MIPVSRAPSPSPSIASSSTLHPLHLPPSPAPPSSSAFASTSSFSGFPSSPSLSAPDPAKTTGVRSRKPTSPLPSSESSARGQAAAESSSRVRVEADVTRPSLRRATHDALGIAIGGADEPHDDDYLGRGDVKGKGKASEGRRAGSDLGAGAGLRPQGEKEREVVVHQVLKTDTLASVSLQYGITPQALRKANRLWPTDPIHFRTSLLIPLDECNLPSSSFGVERIAREENGDITVWERGDAGRMMATDGAPVSMPAFGSAATRAGGEDRIVSPRARRFASASAFELGANGSSSPRAQPHTSDFSAIWDDPAELPRCSFESASTSSPRPSFSPTVSAYLSSTHNPYSFSPSLAPSPPPPTNEQIVSRTVSPATSRLHASPPPVTTSPPDFSRPSTASASTSTSPTPSSATTPPDDHSAPLSKRTLRVERLPASQLAFFAPSSTLPSSTDTPYTSPNPNPNDTSTPTSPEKQRREQQQQQQHRAGAPESSLFFGPLSNSLASLGLGRLDKYLPLPLPRPASFSSSASGGRGGSVALPSCPSPSPSPTRSRSETTAFGGALASASKAVATALPPSWGTRWNLAYFGAEEDEAAARRGLGNGNGNGLGMGLGQGKGKGKREGKGKGEDLRRRSSAIGLEEVGASN
ncbi:hypothetical protein JCM5296_005470 [Sporobolomyces johnsonii]